MLQDCANNNKKTKKVGGEKSKKVKTAYCLQKLKEEFQGVGIVEYFRDVHL